MARDIAKKAAKKIKLFLESKIGKRR